MKLDYNKAKKQIKKLYLFFIIIIIILIYNNQIKKSYWKKIVLEFLLSKIKKKAFYLIHILK